MEVVAKEAHSFALKDRALHEKEPNSERQSQRAGPGAVFLTRFSVRAVTVLQEIGRTHSRSRLSFDVRHRNMLEGSPIVNDI